MKENAKKRIYSLTVSAVFVALATALSFIKVYELPMGGSITLFSMLPIIMLAFMLDKKWSIGAAFCYALLQLLFGITLDGMLGWGLTPLALVGAVFLDYLIPFTCLGFAFLFGKKNIFTIALGTVFVMVLRFLCHFLSGVIIFDIWCEWDSVYLYSLIYNGSFMLPELILTTLGAVILFSLPQIKKLIK